MSQIERREFTCPECGGHFYGTSTENNISTGYCNGYSTSGLQARCGFTWLRRDDAKYFKGTGVFQDAEGVAQKT